LNKLKKNAFIYNLELIFLRYAKVLSIIENMHVICVYTQNKIK